MPRIVLLNPYIKHYAGSVFDLSDVMGDKGYDDDPRLTERMSFVDKRYYSLPDAGNGRPSELSIEHAAICPDDVFNDTNLKSGPCRITSLSKGLENAALDKLKSADGIAGDGCVRLHDTNAAVKNLLFVCLTAPAFPIIVSSYTNPEKEKIKAYSILSEKVGIDLSDYAPGFYFFELQSKDGQRHHFTMIKCFPLVVTFNGYQNNYSTQTTIW